MGQIIRGAKVPVENKAWGKCTKWQKNKWQIKRGKCTNGKCEGNFVSNPGKQTG